MKKNVMMRVASALLVAVLLSTCVISGTFAKYTTEGTGYDQARVAKFGVVVDVDDYNMFSDSYKHAATTYTLGEAGDAITVQADTEGTDIVAPGTEGVLAGIVLKGQPEVDVKVTYDATLELDGWVAGTDPYCPIEIIVDGNTFKNVTNTAALKAAVEAAIEAKTATYDTNTDLSTKTDHNLAVSWRWAFEGNDDAKDTLLGNQAAGGTEATIKLTIKTTVTQID